MGLSCQAQGFHSSVAVKCSPTPTRMLMLPGFPLQRCCKVYSHAYHKVDVVRVSTPALL